MNAIFSESGERPKLPPLMCVGPNHLKAIWPFAEPLLRKAYERMDEFMPSNLYEWLERQKGFLWVGIRDNRIISACTTCLVARPSGLCLRIDAMGGEDLEHVRACELLIAEYARKEGCVKTSCEGRDGWLRAVPGYKPVRTVFEKVL